MMSGIDDQTDYQAMLLLTNCHMICRELAYPCAYQYSVTLIQEHHLFVELDIDFYPPFYQQRLAAETFINI